MDVGPSASSLDIERSRLPRKFPLPYPSVNTLLFASKRKGIGVHGLAGKERERERERESVVQWRGTVIQRTGSEQARQTGRPTDNEEKVLSSMARGRI